MSEFVTVARPYAKAAFDFAVEHQAVERWQNMLAFTAQVTRNEQIAELLSGAVAPETMSTTLLQSVVISSMSPHRTSFELWRRMAVYWFFLRCYSSLFNCVPHWSLPSTLKCPLREHLTTNS